MIPSFDDFIALCKESTENLTYKINNTSVKTGFKKDGSIITNLDIEIEKSIRDAIKNVFPDHTIIGEELDPYQQDESIAWIIDPIDGTSSYIKGGSEYTINAGLIINQKPVAGIIYAPKKKRLFYSFGKNKAYEIFDKKKKIKLDCSKIKKRDKIALTNSSKPSEIIRRILKKYKINHFVSMRSSLKFCMIASSEFDFYAARARAREWDYAAGHAIAEGAGAIVRTHQNKKILYGKRGFKNPSLLIRRNLKV